MNFFGKVKDFLAKSLARKIIAIVLCVVVVGGAATGIILGVSSCGGTPEDKPHTVYDNEVDPLRFSTLEVDGVFNPFFSTSATDSSVIGMTQLSLLGNDENGSITYGDDEEVIAKDLKIVHDKVANTTTYYLVLKNDVKFSNGSYLTMKDVLFNFYVYLDPVYSGSSTMYSTDIVGLKKYRTQTEDANEQEKYMEQYEAAAAQRLNDFADAYNDIADNELPASQNKKFKNLQDLKDNLTAYTNKHSDNKSYANLLNDLEKALGYFDSELESDYNSSIGAWSELKFYAKDKNNKKYESDKKIESDVEMFLYNEGIIEFNEKEDVFKSQVGETELAQWRAKSNSENQDDKDAAKKWAIDLVRAKYVPNDIVSVMYYWSSTSANLMTYLINDEMSKGLSSGSGQKFSNIEGIKFVNKDDDFTFTDDKGNTITYKKPTYHANGDNNARDYVIEGNEVLSITINEVDPKAVWNFGIGIAPMYYYSNTEQIALFDYESHFGVEYASTDFFDNVLNNAKKNGLPVGAGAYAASSANGGLCKTASAPSDQMDLSQSDADAGLFRSKQTIYYERNPYYNMAQNKNEDGSYWTKTAPDGNEYRVAKINRVRYVVRTANNMINSLKAHEIDFAEPNAKPELKTSLGEEGIGNSDFGTSGYGYIGINAGKVPGIHVRRAIMHAIDTDACVKYYDTMAKSINRPMSTTNWAYPQDTIPYYPYIKGEIPRNLLERSSTGGYKYSVCEDYRNYVKANFTEAQVKSGVKLSEDQQKEYLRSLVEMDGYTEGGNGIYSKTSNGKKDELKYKFTVAGDTTDHPAYTALDQAGKILNQVGFSISVKTDADALKLLASGGLTVWAAAWSSTIDPDMYQVYHKDSKATSVLNWGYREILNDKLGKYDTEKDIIVELSKFIDQGRQSEVQDVRKPFYYKALDKVMELAVELPTYQRRDLYAYDQNRIDTNTFFKNPTSFKGLTSNLTSVSLIVS